MAMNEQVVERHPPLAYPKETPNEWQMAKPLPENMSDWEKFKQPPIQYS